MSFAQQRLLAAGHRSLAVAALTALAAFANPKPSHAAVSVVDWGFNGDGQLGNGTTSNSTTPVSVAGLTSGVTSVTGGGDQSFAVQNGGVYAWGNNGFGQLGNGTTTISTTPVAVTGLTSGVTAVAGGYYHSLALRNGGVYAWGYNGDGELGNGTTTNSTTPVALTGTLSTGVTALASGAYHSLAVQNGGVYAWGNNGDGQLGNGTTTNSTTPVALTGTLSTGVTAIAGGHYHSLALRNGGVYAWGYNGDGELGNGTTTNSTTPVALTGTLSTGVTAIAAGHYYSLAVQNGGVYAWGYNNAGQLGNGTTTTSTTPVAVTGITGTITAVSAAYDSSYALAADGSIWDWGANSTGELGLGTAAATRYTTPQRLLAPAGYAYTSVASNSEADHAVATLARPDAGIAASATGTVLGSVAPVGSDIKGYVLQNVALTTPAISGSVQINPDLSNSANNDLIYLGLTDPTQAAALVADLDVLYGATAASLVSADPYPTPYQVSLSLPTSAGTPDFFNFDFTTVVGAGPIDALNPAERDVGSVSIANIGVVPEPTSVAVIATAGLAALATRRRRRTTVTG